MDFHRCDQDRDEQTRLEMKHRKEEDDLYRKFAHHREEEDRRIREEFRVRNRIWILTKDNIHGAPCVYITRVYTRPTVINSCVPICMTRCL